MKNKILFGEIILGSVSESSWSIGWSAADMIIWAISEIREKCYAFYLLSLNLLSLAKEYCILAVELLYGALQIYWGVEIVIDMCKK